MTDGAVAFGWWQAIEPGVLVTDCHLVGAKKDKEHGELRATTAGLEYTGSTHTLIAWSDIEGIDVHGESSKKVSAGRIATMGVLALAAKKTVESTVVAIAARPASVSFITDSGVAEVEGALRRVTEPLSKRPEPVVRIETTELVNEDSEDDPEPLLEDETVDVDPGPSAPGGGWWSGLTPAELEPVMHMVLNQRSKPGKLKVTADCLLWEAGKKSYVRLPWSSFRGATLQHLDMQHGKQHRASGRGIVGMTVVAATQIANAHNARIEHFTGITVVDGTGRKFTFVAELPFDQVQTFIKPVIDAYSAAYPAPAPVSAPQVVSQPLTAPGSIADELKKLAELRDAGVLSDDEFASQKQKLLG